LAGTSVNKKTTGAWIVHHGRKVAADLRGAAEFSAIDLAAKTASLLARLGESDQATLSDEQVCANLADKARMLGIPVWKFIDGGASARQIAP
jgi:hypothetical protein